MQVEFVSPWNFAESHYQLTKKHIRNLNKPITVNVLIKVYLAKICGCHRVFTDD